MRKLILSLVFIHVFSLYCFAWEETATFEGLTVGNAATGTNGFSYAGSETDVSATYNSGSRGVQLNWTTGEEGWSICHGNLTWGGDLNQGDEIWYRAYVQYPSGWQWADTFKKCMRIRINDSGGSSEGWISIILHDAGEILLSNEVDPLSAEDQYSGVYVDEGSWVCLEIYIYLHSTNGIVRIWKNGVLSIDQISASTLGAADSYAGGSIFASSWNSPHSPADQTEYADDFIMTSEQPSNQDAAGNYMIGPTDWTNSGAKSTASGGSRY